MTIEVDKSIYSDSCISKVIYWLSDSFICERKSKEDKEYIIIESRNATLSYKDEVIKALFLQTLHDYKLREIIRAETKDINTILYLKAFADCDQLLEENE